MWSRRREVHRCDGDAYLLAGLNEGAGAGASLEHSHSQLVPFTEVPPAVTAEAAALAQPCVLCAELAPARRLRDPPRGRAGHVRRALGAQPVRDVDRTGTATSASSRDAAPRSAGRCSTSLAATEAYSAPACRGTPSSTTRRWPAGTGTGTWRRCRGSRSPALVELGSGLWINTVDPATAAAELGSATA